MELIFFLLLAVIMVGAALIVITGKKPVNSVLFLILAFFCQAVLYVMLGAPFLAALQVIVYAGAIMVLFVFVLMLLNLKEGSIWEVIPPLRMWLGFGIAAAVFLVAVGALRIVMPLTSAIEPGMGSAARVGEELFTRHLLPFELASVLLLAAIVGVVAMLKQKTEKDITTTGEEQ